jgi:glucosamine--fructose-6-phosphate aminotransferase (isomerizing)
VTTLLEREIAVQGAALRERASGGMGAAVLAARLLGQPGIDHVVIAARGSSDNAARFAQYLLGEELGMQVGLAAPWLFRDPERTPRLTGAAVLAISQSGQSPDVVGVLSAARRQGCPTVAITADADSALGRAADVIIPLLVGEEQSVAATKTYLASLHGIVQLVEAVQPNLSRREWLTRLPSLVDSATTEMLDTRERFDPLIHARIVTVTGRGLLFSAACESALKIRELSGIPAEAFSPPDLKHGPIAALDGSGAAWLIAPDGKDLEVLMSRSRVSVAVTDDPELRDLVAIGIALPHAAPGWVQSILSVISAQAAGLRLAERRGVSVDTPHGLSKVTLTH